MPAWQLYALMLRTLYLLLCNKTCHAYCGQDLTCLRRALQVPEICTRHANGLWAVHHLSRDAASRASCARHAAATHAQQARPAHAGGPPTFYAADAARFHARAVVAGGYAGW